MHSFTSTSETPDWQPTLQGNRVALRPTRPQDLVPMHAAASDPLIWEQHSERNRHERAVFERFFEGALACGGGLTVIDPATDQIIGSTRFYDWDPTDGSIVIGYTFLVRAHWGSGTNREMKTLMLAHAFRCARTVWFHISTGNARSRCAIEKRGARLDREASVLVGGVPTLRCIYRIDRSDRAPA